MHWALRLDPQRNTQHDYMQPCQACGGRPGLGPDRGAHAMRSTLTCSNSSPVGAAVYPHLPLAILQRHAGGTQPLQSRHLGLPAACLAHLHRKK